MAAGERPPRDVLMQLTEGYQISQSIHVAASLGIADLLMDGPRSVGDLAEATGSHPPTLYRLLRALASVGVFVEVDGRFGLRRRRSTSAPIRQGRYAPGRCTRASPTRGRLGRTSCAV